MITTTIPPETGSEGSFEIHRGPIPFHGADMSGLRGGTSLERQAYANAKLIINRLKGLPETNRALYKRLKLIRERHTTGDVALDHLKRIETLMKRKRDVDSGDLRKIVGRGHGPSNRVIALLSLHYNVAKAQVAHIYNREQDTLTLRGLYEDVSKKVGFMPEFRAAIGMSCKNPERQQAWDGIVNQIIDLDQSFQPL